MLKSVMYSSMSLLQGLLQQGPIRRLCLQESLWNEVHYVLFYVAITTRAIAIVKPVCYIENF